MTKNIQNEDSGVVDKSLVTMFVKMSIEERLRANDNAVRTLMELKTVVDLKKASTNFKDKQRLPVLEETLRQLEKK
jgi:hypothetical protein